MAAISTNDIARTVYTLTKDKSGAELAQALKNVVRFLARKRLLGKSGEILSRLQKITNEENDVLEVNVRSADKLEEESKNHLKHLLKQRYHAKGIQFNEIIDGSLLGGLRLEVADEVIDLSLKNRILKLKEHLIR